ncbi:MAG TPA: hypothetical protein ENI52_03330 [Thermoplasmata archaeon]|nr:hypothetical protein [Thermoplasmata archaeon]
MKEKEIELIPGSKYIIYSIGSEKEMLQTSGIFVGYSYLSKDEIGICIKMDSSHGSKKNKTRIIPAHMILAIDIIEEKKVRKKGEDEAKHYFG